MPGDCLLKMMYGPATNDEKLMHLDTQINRSMRDSMDSDDN